MIIGINGKIGTGKDTVGKIIQYLTRKKLCPECTFEEFLQFYYCNNKNNQYNSNWEVKKFAGKLKQIASILTGIPVEKFEEQEFKKTFLGDEWNQDNENGWKMSVRQLLQRLGTEALRNGLHENVWVNALFSDYNDILIKQTQSVYSDKANNPTGILNIPPEYGKPNWIITDLRFENEFQAVKDRNGICVKVNRPPEFVDQDAFDAYKKGLHPSETALDNHTFDWEIENNSSIEDLVEEVRKMLINFKII